MKKFLIILMATLLLIGCGNTSDKKVETNEKAMADQKVSTDEKVNADENVKYEKYTSTMTGAFDTVIQSAVFEKDEESAREYLNYIEKRFMELHKKFDSFNNYDGIVNVKTINDNAGEKPVKVDDEIFDLIQFSLNSYEKYSHKTNILVGPLTEIWTKYRDAYAYDEQLTMPSEEEMKAKEAEVTAMFGSPIPTEDEIKSILNNLSKSSIELDPQNKTVFLKQKYMKLDVGSVAKGYASEMIKRELEEKGVTAALISAGGNVVSAGDVTKVREPGNQFYTIGVESPDGKNFEKFDGIVAKLKITNESVVTSGDYQRFFEAEGKRYCHIIDPDTGYPENYWRSVTVVVNDSGLADFLSTSLFVMSPSEVEEFMNAHKDVKALFVTDDGNIHPYGDIEDMLIGD